MDSTACLAPQSQTSEMEFFWETVKNLFIDIKQFKGAKEICEHLLLVFILFYHVNV